MSTWHVETTSGAINSGTGTRAESDKAPVLNDQNVWVFQAGAEVTLLVPSPCVAYIKRVDQ